MVLYRLPDNCGNSVSSRLSIILALARKPLALDKGPDLLCHLAGSQRLAAENLLHCFRATLETDLVPSKRLLLIHARTCNNRDIKVFRSLAI